MRFLAIDGNSIMNRAFYGIKMLTNKKGMFTNAIVGFMNIYLKNKSEVNPDCTAVAFDLCSPTFRHKAVETYKANRKGMPPELAEQMPYIKKLLTALGIKVIECEGYEADDVLGTIAKTCSEKGHECYVLTGDRDSLQLIDDKVTIRLATTKETILYNKARFLEDYGFSPIQLIDLKSLMGDSSDNIKGVAGIGEKTAKKLISENGTIEKIYENLDAVDCTKAVKTKLEAGAESAKESKWLATIDCNAPIDTNIQNYKNAVPDRDEVSSILTELEMFSLLTKLNIAPSEVKEQLSFTDEKKSAEPIELCTLDEGISDEIVKSSTIYFMYKCSELFVLHDKKIYKTDNKDLIIKVLECDAQKVTFSAKSAYKLLFENKKCLNNVKFDAELAAYLLSPATTEYSVSRLCSEHNITLSINDDVTACETAALPELSDMFKTEISEKGLEYVLYEIEQPLTEVLASMEHCGISVDSKGVREFGDWLTDDIEDLQRGIFEEAGHEFNISSPKQLGVVLFDEMSVPSKKKTKSGYSTNADVLDSLKDSFPIVEMVLKYRQLTKLKSTYVEGLLKTVANDGRIHTSFKQTETRTGRISSTEPNMQNIPVRTEIGRNMRKFFVAPKGRVLLDADYSQIELRILAHLCNDENMIKAFLSGFDIHSATAAQVFHMPPELITQSMRSAAKAVNFGIIYGIGAFSLSKDIGVSVAEADRYIKDYLANYPNVEKFMTGVVDDAKETGIVSTMFGRIRQVPELNASNKMLQAAGKRIAMNTPIQGTAADVIKIAMVKVYRKLKEENLDAKLILQVHDELIVEAAEKDAKRAGEIVHEEMENACKMKVPLLAEVNQGDSWYGAKG